jgi:hypothetical protein
VLCISQDRQYLDLLRAYWLDIERGIEFSPTGLLL